MAFLGDLGKFTDDDPFVIDPWADPNPASGPGPPPPGGNLGPVIPTPSLDKGNIGGIDYGSPWADPRGGGGGGGGDVGMGFPSFGFGAVPKFQAPRFTLPSFEEAQQEPGYKFRAQAGSDALERAAASKGLLRSGGTLKDLATWNSDFAAQEYGAVANRALNVFDRRYQGARDEYAPLLAEWSQMSNAQLQKALAEYSRGTVWNAPRGGGGGGGVDLDTMPDPSDYGL